MKDLEFKNLKCNITITCFSEDGEIENFEDLEDESKNEFKSLLDNIVIENNNVLTYDISDVVILDNGVDKEH